MVAVPACVEVTCRSALFSLSADGMTCGTAGAGVGSTVQSLAMHCSEKEVHLQAHTSTVEALLQIVKPHSSSSLTSSKLQRNEQATLAFIACMPCMGHVGKSICAHARGWPTASPVAPLSRYAFFHE